MILAALPRRFSFHVYRTSQPVRGLGTALALISIFAALALVVRVFCRDAYGFSPFWPANGASAVALLVLPKRLGILVLGIDCLINIGMDCLISMAANLNFQYSIHALIVGGILNCTAAVLLAIFVRNFCGAATDLSRFRRLGTFIGLAIIAAGLEAGVGEILNAIVRAPDLDIGGWFWWTLCDSLGLIIATPAILLCVKNKRYVNFSDTNPSERILLFALILSVAMISFLQDHSSLYIFIYPLLVLMAFRAGPAWVLASVLAASIVVSALTLHGHGPLVSIAPSDAHLKQSVLQQFVLSLFVCAVPANNALGDMGRAARRLRRIHATARNAQRAAVAANLAKSQFIANVSHEIRTPLNGVLGMAQSLANSELSASQRQRVEIIHSSGELLLSILNDVLDFSKIEAGKLDLEATPFDLVKVVGDVQAAFSAVAENKNITLDLWLEQTRIGELYVGDPTRVRQIISNLVSNALKFTEVGGVKIVVSCLGDGVVVSVRDTGIGIPEDKLSRLFGQFEQVDASTTRRFGGTGLGLSICHQLCRLMGGRIVVESQVGTGSTFTVHLPLQRTSTLEGPPSREKARACNDGDATTGDLRVLAAEDNKINQLVLATFLQQMGVTLTMVEDGALAVEAWRAGAFDLILMDMQMPVMDGLTAVRTIRAAEALSDRPRAPIIALTADVMSHHLDEYRRAGVDAVVAKPIQFAELAQAMRSALEAETGPDALALMRA